jgi:hypothetical protein
VKRAAIGHSAELEWSAAQFADAALLLLNSKHNAVTKKMMEIQLGSHVTDDVMQQQLNGQPVLAALVKAHMLSVRPMSSWALDIPKDPEASYGAYSTIVTAASSTVLNTMDTMRPKLQLTLERCQQKQQQKQVRVCVVDLQLSYHVV